MMENLKFYYDIEERELYYQDDFLEEYHEILKEREQNGDDSITFREYLNNCMVSNNGTLELIVAESREEALKIVKSRWGI